MSDYQERLKALSLKKEKLIAEESALIQKRKKEIAQLAEQFDLLTAPNTLILGLFSELQDALKSKSNRLKEWSLAGERFLQSKVPVPRKSRKSSTALNDGSENANQPAKETAAIA